MAIERMPVHYDPEELDIETKIRSIYTKIIEMDSDRFSAQTIPIKAFIEKALNERMEVNPSQIDRLEEMTNELYFGDYLKIKEIRENDGEYETNPVKRKYFEMIYKGRGFYGVNKMSFSRMEETRWRTSDVGEGYTTLAGKEPDWLEFREPEKWQEISSSGDRGKDKVYRLEKEAESEIFKIPVKIIKTEYQHLNGSGYYYKLYFNSKEDSDIFARTIADEEKKNISPDEMLRDMQDSYHLFKWNQFSTIDPKYYVFDESLNVDGEESWSGSEFIEDNAKVFYDGEKSFDAFINKFGPYIFMEKRNSLSRAIQAYETKIDEKLLAMTEKIAKKEEEKAREEIDRSKFEYNAQYERAVSERVLQARQKAINWKMIKDVIGDDFEKEILDTYFLNEKEIKERKREIIAKETGDLKSMLQTFFENSKETGQFGAEELKVIKDEIKKDKKTTVNEIYQTMKELRLRIAGIKGGEIVDDKTINDIKEILQKLEL